MTASVALYPPQILHPGLQGEKLATNRLIYTKVFLLLEELIFEG
jgi:hypothetical protein